MSCPDENLLVDYADGGLEPDALAQIDEHLDTCPECRGAMAAIVGTAPAQTRPRIQPGAKAGRFEVRDALGAGGMGLVFSAYDPELDRMVALKVLRTRKDAGRDRLLREAQALARVTHPNVISVFDVGALGPDVYVAMELVRGMTLRQWRSSERPTPARVLEVFERIGFGLDAAHQAGVVHRDLKPDNVMIGEDGGVKVLDFGLARFADTAEEENPTPEPESLDLQLTQTGTVVGTPAYMAPEQHDGRVDARSDQYAFCVALYEAIYGTRPFTGRDLEEIVAAKNRGEFRFPKTPSVPTAVRTAIRRGLSPVPNQRWPDIACLLTALHRKPLSPWLITTALAMTAAAVWVVNRPTLEPPATLSHVAFDHGPRRAELAARLRRADLAHAAKVYDEAVELGDDALAALAAAVATSEALLQPGGATEAATWMEHADALRARSTLAPPVLAQIELSRARLLVAAGEHRQALEVSRKAIARADESGDARLRVFTRDYLAGILGTMKPRWEEALTMRRELLRLAREEDLDPEDVAAMLLGLGYLQHSTGDIAGAEATGEEAAQLFDSSSDDEAKRAEALMLLTRVAAQKGDVAEAIRRAEEALEICVRLRGGDDDLAQLLRRTLMALYLAVGDLDSTETAGWRAVTAMKANEGPGSGRLIRFYEGLADTARFKGQLEKALELRTAAKDIGDGFNRSLDVDLAGDHLRLGDHARAEALLNALPEEMSEDVTARTDHERGRLLLERKRPDDARAPLERAYDWVRATRFTVALHTRLEILDAFARALEGSGDKKRARAVEAEAKALRAEYARRAAGPIVPVDDAKASRPVGLGEGG